MSETFTGVVVDWNHERAFGFIGRDDGEADAFIHIKDCLTEDDGLEIGTRVRFRLRNNQRTGRIQAFDCAAIIAEPVEATAVGTITHWDQEGRFCFIKQDSGGEDVFAHRASVSGGATDFPIGTRVKFTAGPNPRTGRPRALAVHATK